MEQDNWEIEYLSHNYQQLWEARAAKDYADLVAGRYPSSLHWPIEIMTLEQVIERYGIDQEQIEKLKQITDEDNRQVDKETGR